MIAFDLETTANGGPTGDSPEAHWRINEVILCGWKMDGAPVQIDDHTGNLADEIQKHINHNGEVTLVAHNAKFDLKYLMRDHPEVEWECVKVWDTMTWEYLNSGHRWTFPSLEDVASKRGLTFKKSLDLGAILATGTKMEDIPLEDLTPYLEEDVRVLMGIHARQRKIGERWMDYILPLAEMELNGLPLDITGAEILSRKLFKEETEAHAYIRDYIMDHCVWQDGSAVVLDDFSPDIFPKTKRIKPTSNRTISLLLTGEPDEIKVTQKWRLSLKGQPLLSSVQKGIIYNDIEATHIGLPVDEDTLDLINVYLKDEELVNNLIKYRKAHKIVSTYLLPMIEQARIQGTVHPKLNTAVTSTGRLSSSAPNGQNMPEIVRQLIVAGQPGHSLEEIDYSQLEMVGAATLSGDKQMQYDLNHKVDVHKNTATKVFGAANAEEKRKLAKNVNFGVLYGGKAHGLSKQTGVDKDTIQDLIDAFYASYPGVAKWQRLLFEGVVDEMEVHDVKDGHQRYRSDYTLHRSGRKFRFIETKAPNWVVQKTGRRYSFSPNHTANYPIQGFAGGDIVMYGLWYLWKELRHDKVLGVEMRMTVHDSVLLQKYAGADLTPYYDKMISATERRFNLPVHLEYDLETGLTWS